MHRWNSYSSCSSSSLYENLEIYWASLETIYPEMGAMVLTVIAKIKQDQPHKTQKTFYICIYMSWKDDSAIESSGCSTRGPRIWFPDPHCNASSRGSGTCLWPLQLPSLHIMHTHTSRQNTHSHNKIKVKIKLSLMWPILFECVFNVKIWI